MKKKHTDRILTPYGKLSIGNCRMGNCQQTQRELEVFHEKEYCLSTQQPQPLNHKKSDHATKLISRN
jgi:hypothetical protein